MFIARRESQAHFPHSMISIAFGGPHICDREAARNINENEHIKWRFINIVNQSDPVPCLLHDIQNTVKEITRTLQEGFSHRHHASWRTTGALIGQCIDAYDDGSVVKCVTVAALGVLDIGRSAVVIKVGELAQRRLEQLRARDHKNIKRSKNESDFYPIGNCVFMEQDSNPWGDKETQYIRHCVNDESVKMQRKLGEVKLGIADVQYHEIASYRSVMAATSLIDGPNFHSSLAEHQYEVNLVVSTPAPTVSANDVWSS
jgi:hypothetical protein